MWYDVTVERHRRARANGAFSVVMKLGSMCAVFYFSRCGILGTVAESRAAFTLVGTWKIERSIRMEEIFREAQYRTVKLADMHPAPYNPRFDLQPGDIAYDNLKKSVIKNGLLQPLVYNPVTGNIVGGNQRYKILLDMGAEEVICACMEYASIEDEMAAAIALNKAQGRWENALLIELFDKLDKTDVDFAAMGFDEDEVEHLYSGLDDLQDEEIFDFSQEPEKKPAMITCPCCGKKFEERENRVTDG